MALLDELLLGQSRFLQGVVQCLYLIWGHPDVHRVLGYFSWRIRAISSIWSQV